MMIQRESYGYDQSYGYDRRRRHHDNGGPALGIQAPGVSIGAEAVAGNSGPVRPEKPQ